MFKKSVSLLPSAALVAILGSVPSFADIKIGVLVPDSGPAGLFGPSTRNSATLAAQDINAAGGINGEQIELVFADVGVPPAEAAQAALRLWKGQGVQAFVGMHDSAVREALIGRFNGQVPYVYTPVMRVIHVPRVFLSRAKHQANNWRQSFRFLPKKKVQINGI